MQEQLQLVIGRILGNGPLYKRNLLRVELNDWCDGIHRILTVQ